MISFVTGLHAMQMLQLIVELLLTSNGQLDPLYCNSQDPSAQQPVSVLQQHLSWAGNASMSGPLLHWAKTIGPPAIRLLRLTCRFAVIGSLVPKSCLHELACWAAAVE